jgi:hypothetical protein
MTSVNFRATQWVMRGIDLRAGIARTQRHHYNDALFTLAPSHAMRSIAEVQKAEAADFEKARAPNGRQAVGSEAVGDTSPDKLLIVECRKEDSNLHPLARTRT